MKFVFYTNSISAHQLPLARELVARLGAENYRYVYTGSALQGGGQEVGCEAPWAVRADAAGEALLSDCDVLMVGGLRPIDLIERRAAGGRITLYYTERWFKPIPLFSVRWGTRGFTVCVPGCLRMLVPRYRRMARRFVAWLRDDPAARCLAVGPWAARDMRRLGVPAEKIVPWAYFVEPGERGVARPAPSPDETRILWVGRMLDWKRVETIVRAVALANAAAPARRFRLTLVGDGPERPRLRRLAAVLGAPVDFRDPVGVCEIRGIMRAHDVYVLASDMREGWGAALNEALEEGLSCFGTHEAGASAALLPAARRFPAGDFRALARVLAAADLPRADLPRDYAPAGAAERLLTLVAGLGKEAA